ncbi:GntR family transcriptional regulator [Advenella kashmirensis W13003]|uniref:GntR family transcriptional regulator n=1 Tax=Advenella kashmirensis W13003 TaxID=1424334 RepID=V8QQF0_9BURK|nr:GntR family transcriptional regulator [Advenella kashmirensis]ETF01558.1 GntR family transcriptional regulator [Advenella kashmirensis W13003]
MKSQEAYFQNEAIQIGRYAKTLPEQVAEHLMKAIQEGVIEPGERMKEETYSERFAVSRSTIREAMSILEKLGVVERIPRYGVRVTAYDPREIEHIFLIRAQLLGLAASQVASRCPPEVKEQLEAGVDRLKQLANDRKTKPVDYMEISVNMQRILMSASGIKRLHTMYEALSDQALWRFAIREKAISFLTQERRKQSAADWERVVSNIVEGAADQAENAAKALLQASYQAVKEVLRKRE